MIRQATILSPEDAAAVFGTRRLGGRQSTYPWSEWLDGQARVFTMLEHFPSFKKYRTLETYIRNTARRRGIKVEIRRNAVTEAFTLRAINPPTRSEDGTDAPYQDMEAHRAGDSRSVRHKATGTQRGKQQPRKRKR